MPDHTPLDRPAPSHAFAPRALRIDPAERRRLEALTERALARHPAWPWPLIEAEARRALAAARPTAEEAPDPARTVAPKGPRGAGPADG